MIPQTYEVRFFSVGTETKGGDAIFIRFIDDSSKWKVIVIDGGYGESGEHIVDYMKSLDLSTIDLMVNTHPDLDHISGLLTIMDSDIQVTTLVYHRPWHDADLKADMFQDNRITDKSVNRRLRENFSKAYELEQKAFAKGCSINTPELGDTYFGCFTILGPTKDLYQQRLLESDKTPTVLDGEQGSIYQKIALKFRSWIDRKLPINWIPNEDTSAINDTSIVSLLRLQNMNILFTGDAGKRGLNAALKYLYDILPHTQINLLQLPHHGSRRNVDPQLLKSIAAKEYFISCPPKGEEDGHPSKRLVNVIYQLFPDATVHKNNGSRNFIYHSDNLSIKATPVGRVEPYDEIED